MGAIIHCGTSGWNRPDWDSVVFPRLRPRGFHALEHLAGEVDVIEVDSAYERPVRPELARLWLKKVALNPDLVFTVPLGREFTLDRGLDPERVRIYKEGLEPLAEAHRLGCVLMRFPWSFRFTRENRDFVVELRRTFPEYPLVAELRHASWTYDEALGTLMDYRIGFCNLDQREGARATPPTAIVTSGTGYIRLLGRGGDDWTQDESLANYLYTSNELAEWQPRIERVARHTTATYVVAANAARGKSMVNAMQLRSMLADLAGPVERRAVANVVTFASAQERRPA
ncbi:MAG: DUF72 domain-containing protein [Bryobacteraceae bacterium]